MKIELYFVPEDKEGKDLINLIEKIKEVYDEKCKLG